MTRRSPAYVPPCFLPGERVGRSSRAYLVTPAGVAEQRADGGGHQVQQAAQHLHRGAALSAAPPADRGAPAATAVAPRTIARCNPA